MVTLHPETRRELTLLARRGSARIVKFDPAAPSDWRPDQVRNPDGVLDPYFTDTTAWEFIATKLEEMHPVEIIELEKPPGKKGYVMKIDIGPGSKTPQLYVKLQLGSGQIIGRSFHYSNY